ncbi:DUF4221 domain-containing protein [Aquiflexum sp. LQ15W]|uniref:DUF4221 family protein n=1 Tax=Cognataquiflexum nitidum TaxID=2922272 RepID=UPI001F138EB4|nr:DUF4221 family protein [Cognataquiflexum nitidum]MCH6199646.1 DUF4221 domain-containing protein [Cognataquiflexum nitidum]
MKNYLILISILFLFSCGSSTEKKADFSQMTFSLDTVMVDSKDEILYLNGNLMQSSLSQDLKYLYNFNQQEFSLEKISLDALELQGKIKLEKEGPNGIGDFVSNFNLLGEDRFLVQGFSGLFILDSLGKILKKLEYGGFEKGSLSSEEFMMRLFSLPSDPNTHYGFSVAWESNNYVFNKVEIENNKNTRFEMPEFDKLKEYRIELIMNGAPAGGMGPSLFISTSMDKVILSNEIANEFYVLANDETTLEYISLQSSLTPNRKKENTVNQVESIEALSELYKKSQEDINFSKPVWDNENRIFYRFSYFKRFLEKENEGAQPLDLPESNDEVYLTILDENLQIIGESKVPELKRAPSTHFVKDGKIWIFENIDDELAFVRLSIDSK